MQAYCLGCVSKPERVLARPPSEVLFGQWIVSNLMTAACTCCEGHGVEGHQLEAVKVTRPQAYASQMLHNHLST